MTDWLRDCIREAQKKRMKTDERADQQDQVEIDSVLFEELSQSGFVSGKIIPFANTSIGKNGTGVFLLKQKAVTKRKLKKRKQFGLGFKLTSQDVYGAKKLKLNPPEDDAMGQLQEGGDKMVFKI